MKKILTVSFVALISVISAGNAAIPDKTYVDANLDSKVGKASVVDIDNATDLMSVDSIDELKGKVVGADAFVGVNEFMTQVYNTAITGNPEKLLNMGSGDMGANVVPNLESPNKESIVGGINSVYDVVKTNKSNIETLGNAVKANQDAIGATTNLTTTDKSSLVAAVNEVRDETGSVAAQASELSSKVDHLEDIDAELTGKIDTNAGQIETQGAQIAAYGESITGLDDRLGTAESDISALKTDKVNKTDLGNLAYQDKLTNNFVDDAAIAQAKVNGLTDALAAKVDDSQVVATGGTVTSSDAQVPTIARMEAAIANAKPDTSGLVDKAAVVVSGGTNTMTGATVANNANKDTYVPTVAYAQEMAASAASDAVSGLDAEFQKYVPYATGIGDGFLVTDPTGNVYVDHGVPKSITDAMDEKVSAKLNKPVGECLTPGNCVLVFSGYSDDGEITLVWEKVARSLSDVQAE